MEESLKNLLLDIKSINENEKLTEPQNENMLKLAFVGDTIFDLFTRDYLNRKYADKIKISELHKKNSDLVCAKSQSKISEYLINNVFNENANTIAIIVIISLVSVTAIGGYFFIKRREQN